MFVGDIDSIASMRAAGLGTELSAISGGYGSSTTNNRG
jgi:hypothetical protein